MSQSEAGKASEVPKQALEKADGAAQYSLQASTEETHKAALSTREALGRAEIAMQKAAAAAAETSTNAARAVRGAASPKPSSNDASCRSHKPAYGDGGHGHQVL